MSKSLFFVSALLMASRLEGVPITGEVVYRGAGFGAGNSLSLEGPNFSITAIAGLTLSEGLSYCFLGGCPPDAELRLQDGIGEDVFSTSGTIDGVFYPNLSWGGPGDPDQGGFVVLGSVSVPSLGGLTANSAIRVEGRLVLFDAGNTSTCLICRLLFTAPGQVTMTFKEIQVSDPPITWLETTEMRYEFTSIPEPSTRWLMLLCGGFFAWSGYCRKRML